MRFFLSAPLFLLIFEYDPHGTPPLRMAQCVLKSYSHFHAGTMVCGIFLAKSVESPHFLQFSCERIGKSNDVYLEGGCSRQAA